MRLAAACWTPPERAGAAAKPIEFDQNDCARGSHSKGWLLLRTNSLNGFFGYSAQSSVRIQRGSMTKKISELDRSRRCVAESSPQYRPWLAVIRAARHGPMVSYFTNTNVHGYRTLLRLPAIGDRAGCVTITGNVSGRAIHRCLRVCARKALTSTNGIVGACR